MIVFESGRTVEGSALFERFNAVLDAFPVTLTSLALTLAETFDSLIFMCAFLLASLLPVLFRDKFSFITPTDTSPVGVFQTIYFFLALRTISLNDFFSTTLSSSSIKSLLRLSILKIPITFPSSSNTYLG